MNKTSKISYKTYFNDRLKPVFFHGQLTHPLYVQVTFERKTIFFKSYYFELFSKSRYLLIVPSLKPKAPTLEEVAVKEKEVIDFIISSHADDFSLELFKKEYAYYSTDLCDAMEKGFVEYLYVFFHDEGLSPLAITISQGIKYQVAYELVRDFKSAFNIALYDKLVKNALFYAPPYLPLYGFMQETKRWPMLLLTVMEWETADMKAEFINYVIKYYPYRNANAITEQVEAWLGSRRNIKSESIDD